MAKCENKPCVSVAKTSEFQQNTYIRDFHVKPDNNPLNIQVWNWSFESRYQAAVLTRNNTFREWDVEEKIK